jgi:hypothetical protein
MNWPWLWAVHCQRHMGTETMVILEVAGQNAPQMRLVQHDDVIEHLAPDAPEQPFHIRILPRRARGTHDLLDPHMPDALPKLGAIDVVAIAQQIAWRCVPGEGVHHLLSGPLSRGMLGDVEVHEPLAVVGQN